MPMTTRYRGTKVPARAIASPLNALVPRKRKSRKPPVVASKNLKIAIKKEVSKAEETKYVSETLVYSGPGTTYPSTYVNFNSKINTSADWYRCLPVTGQGVDSYQRIGNRIKPLSVTVKWNFRFDTTATDAYARDIEIVLFIVKEKSRNRYQAAATNGAMESSYATFLDAGNGTNTDYDGTSKTLMYPVDNNSITLVKKKLIRLYKPAGLQNDNDLTKASTTPLRASATYSHTFKKVPTLKYELASSVIPDNFNYCWAVGYRYLDGSAPDATGGLLAVDAQAQMRFKDA